MSEEEKVELEELYENSEWWHNRFNAVQRDYEELKKRNKELEDGFKATTDELCEYATKRDKAIEYIKKHSNNCMFELRIEELEELLAILGGEENE